VDGDHFADRVAGVAALADPVRRGLYLHVSGQPEPVSRDQAAAALGVPRHTAKFHLDKLVEAGLLDRAFQRTSGRSGPGAGRPTKVYRRSDRQVSVTLPERRYELAAGLLARAVDDAMRTSAPVEDTLHAAATAEGARLAHQTTAPPNRDSDANPDADWTVTTACAILADHGYEPRRGERSVTLANCPFDALARDHTRLVCGMNLAMLTEFGHQLGNGSLTARLDPNADRCCVVFDTGR
jgi:predicted ArsR family transcriptional regulator